MVPPGEFSPPSRPGVPQDDGHNSSDQRLSSRIESFSDIAEMEFGGYYYGESSFPITSSPPSSPSLRGRESLVSLPTQRSNSTLGIARLETRSWFATIGENAYQHIGGSTLPDLGRTTSMQSVDSIQHAAEDIPMAQAVPEDRESMDIALIPAAAPIHGVGPSASSPEYTDLEMSKWQEQEKAGRLSNGLGVGLKPETTIREADLMSSDPQVASPRLSRSMSLTGQKPLLSRSATRKALGQDTADRTGQAVQVIIEDPESEEEDDYALLHRDSTASSSFTSRDAVHSEELADLKNVRTKSTGLRPRVQRTETFYPHPDWKPFSMRWPYLTMLILLSIALAGLTEALYQSSARKPLVSFNTPQEIKPGVYFVIKFLPTIVAVTYGVLWQVTDFEVRRLEAFHQLSKEGGATAAETLNVDYITNLSFLRPLHAFRLCHYAVTVSSVASLLAVSAVPTLTSACIILTPDRKERTQHPEGTKKILVDPTWSRVLEVVLLLIALMGGVLFAQLRSRRSGLLADVKGIAGLAAMANVSHILMDFKDMDVATHKDIHQKLAHNRYILRNSSLAPLSTGENDPSTAREDDHGASGLRSSFEHKFHLSLNPHPLMLRAAGCVPFITGILLFAALLPILLFTPAGYLTDKAPWVVTALAVCIKLAWGAVDTNVRMIEPFFILYKRHAPPKTLTLDYTAMPFAWVALKALLNRHWLVFAVGFGTIMTEVLTVLVTSLATVEGKEFARMIRDDRGGTSDGGGDIRGGQETAGSFWISFGLATFILLYMGAVATVVFVRRRKPFLPRQPNTIASVLAFIHQSKMLWSFVGTEKLGNREILQFLDEVGQTYGLGWFEGRDGREHCGIDQEELKTSYRHGLDYSRSNKPWAETFSEWL